MGWGGEGGKTEERDGEERKREKNDGMRSMGWEGLINM